jgi:hypothetical protein
VQGDVTVPSVREPAAPPLDGRDQVLGAPQHRDDVRRGGDLGRVDDSERRLAERHDPPVAAEPVELRAGLRLGQHDLPVPGPAQRRDVRRVLGGAGRIDPDDDPRGVEVPLRQRGDERRPRRVLAVGADAVLQVDDDRVGGGQGLRVPVGPVGRAEEQRGTRQGRQVSGRHHSASGWPW